MTNRCAPSAESRWRWSKLRWCAGSPRTRRPVHIRWPPSTPVPWSPICSSAVVGIPKTCFCSPQCTCTDERNNKKKKKKTFCPRPINSLCPPPCLSSSSTEKFNFQTFFFPSGDSHTHTHTHTHTHASDDWKILWWNGRCAGSSGWFFSTKCQRREWRTEEKSTKKLRQPKNPVSRQFVLN